MVERVRPKVKVERVKPKTSVARVRPKDAKSFSVTVRVELWIDDHRVSGDDYVRVPVDALPGYEANARRLFYKHLKDDKNKNKTVMVFFIDARGPYMAARGSMRGTKGKLLRAHGVLDVSL